MDDLERLEEAEAWASQYFIECDRLSAMSPDTHERRQAGFMALAMTAAGFVDRDEPIPQQLKRFVVNILVADTKKAKGNKISRNAVRDFYLASAVYFVCKNFDLPSTRNDVSSAHSACDVVAKAASKQGINVSYDVVKKLLSKYRDFSPSD